ncbi:HB06p [Pyrus ussuriensis x Pyrus communis]|uniref:HB06p n=1 Tax=Pyrus ussuriensis x Pyrus communis TaxID=2448454 RepID=A0A5N5F5U9_9ROSA|nr:HB06p [Pyrus ussuriensis x Pyrus communis]
MTNTPDVYKVLLMYDTYLDNVKLVTKGREAEYGWIMLRLVVIMDLSKNMISGEIPEELTSLHGLQSLNLSKNLLTGRIPSKLGNMKCLTFPSNLNLSCNNLMGEIPKSTQLQSLDHSCFIGNELCGAP